MEFIEAALATGQLTVWADIADATADTRGLGRLRSAVLLAAQRAGWSQPETIVEGDTLGVYDNALPASVAEAADIIALFRRPQ